MFDVTDSANLNKEYNGFVLISIEEIKDYKAKAVYLRHKTTGLEVYHVIKDDKENLFAFAFRTLAKDSKGTAHIMEHSTLCGSERYPLKEPFNTLASTSINTFLNAMTYPDKTVYPGASLVRADYFNMMSVYADSVFFPKLDYTTFIQEGHRLELDEKGNPVIQGVVYNEMKGNYSSFPQVAYSETISAMYPDSYPAFDSGGDPLEIPSLTYQEFLDFHQKFYNPDNCILFLYGNIPTVDQLDFLNKEFMSRIEKKYNCSGQIKNLYSTSPIIKDQLLDLIKLNVHTESKEIRRCAPEQGSTGEMVNLAWYTGSASMEKLFLNEVLCGNDSSPISKVLKDSRLGDEQTSGPFGQFKEEFWTFGMMGVKKSNEDKLFDLITKTLKDLYENGISQEDIDSAVMGIDFTLREINRFWGPYSMQIMEKVLKDWTNGNKCSASLNPISSFELVKEKLRSDKDYTKKLIKKYFLDNKTCIKIIVEPSDQYFKNRNQKEALLISKLSQNLNKEELKKDLDKLHEYQQHIESAEESACIPVTRLSELDPVIEYPKIIEDYIPVDEKLNVPLFISKEETNGLFYMEVLFPFDTISPKYYKYMTFLSNIITNLGWNKKGWDKCIAQSACIMGDVWGKLLVGNINDCPECNRIAEEYKDKKFMGRNWLGIATKAVTEKAGECLNVLSEIITKMDFDDVKRFKTLANENYSEFKSGFVSGGREFAIKRARAASNKSNALIEILWGISQGFTVKEYKKNARKHLKIFEKLYQECLNNGAIIHLTCDEASLEKIKPLLKDFCHNAKLKALKEAKEVSLEEILENVSQYKFTQDKKGLQAIQIETQTGYSVAASSSSKYLTKEASAEQVLTAWFSLHPLWDKIRTSGGAYGAGSYADNGDESSIFYSYRDPSPLKSLQIYKESLKEVIENPVSAEDVEKTIVSNYGSAILPLTPKEKGERGFQTFIYAEPEDSRQRRVNNLLSVKAEDVAAAAKRLYDYIEDTYRQVIFCDKSNNITSKKLKLPL